LFRSAEELRSLKRPSQRTVPAETDSALATRLDRIEYFILAVESGDLGLNREMGGRNKTSGVPVL